MKKSQVQKTCIYCKSIYSVKKSRDKKSHYCSIACKSRQESINQRGRKMPIELVKEKYGPHSRLSFAKSCGRLTKKGRIYCAKCRIENVGKTEKSCEACGENFFVYRSVEDRYKCCSNKCRAVILSIRQAGSKSHLWKGGLTEESRRLRNSAKYGLWRSFVMARDNYTCVECGVRGGNLCADHIKSWSLYPALRFDIDNGRTMCYPCHQKTPNFGYKAQLEIKKYSTNSGGVQLCLI